jgi:raw score 5.28
MTLEKKIAIASVALCLLTPLALLLLYFEFTNSYEITSLRIQVFFEILAWFWGPMIASFILYTRLRSAAVTASALLAFALYALLSCLLGKDGGGLVGELIWLLYSIWGAACFVLSSLIVLFKPAIFIRSAKSAFFSTLIINLLAAPLAIMIFKTM